MPSLSDLNNLASPPAIGSDNPNTGKFTTLEASGLITANAGINFGEDTLSAYDEGTFTLTPLGLTTAGSPTTSTNLNRYIRIGKMVFCNGYFVLTSKGGMAGAIAFDGLPFTSVNNGGARAVGVMLAPSDNFDISGISGATSISLYMVNNTSRMLLRANTTTGSATPNESNIDDNFAMYWNLSYEVA